VSRPPTPGSPGNQPAEMTFVPNPQAGQDERRMPIRLRVLAADSQLVFFHRIYESIVLGTRSTIPCPRRSQIAPTRSCLHCMTFGRCLTVLLVLAP
jgi:hypothetical protein